MVTTMVILTKYEVKYCTYKRYLSYVEFQINPYLGNFELDEISARHLQNFMAELSEKYSPGTINCIISLVKRSLIRAEEFEEKHIHLNFNARCKRNTKKVIKCLSAEDQKKLECYINCSFSPKLYGFIICLYTGLRIGELLALRWSDVDLKNGTLKVNKTCHDSYGESGYEKFIDTPKTYNSLREIPLPAQIIPHLKLMKSESKSEYVISGKDGKEISKRSYQSTFCSVLKKLGIPHMGIHCLRHTFATRALECGMDVKTLSEILGHSSAAITLNCYVHSLSEHKRNMMNKVGKLLR